MHMEIFIFGFKTSDLGSGSGFLLFFAGKCCRMGIMMHVHAGSVHEYENRSKPTIPVGLVFVSHHGHQHGNFFGYVIFWRLATIMRLVVQKKYGC
jgi:hypothetical protein